MSDRNMKTVREACVHGRYERHGVTANTIQGFVEICDPWGEGKNTLQLDRMVNLRPMKSKWIRWVSEWEQTDD